MYIVSTFVPLTVFIGSGAGFITLAIIVTPVIAAILRPAYAFVAALIGSVGMALAQTSFMPVFGLAGLLIPVVAIVAGSIGFHYKLGPTVPWACILFGAAFYFVYSNGTALWLAPYVLALLSLPIVLSLFGDLPPVRTGLLSFMVAMVEQVGLSVESILVLGLTGAVWTVITPFMFLERTVATVGGATAILALKNRFGATLFQNDHPLEVNV